MAATGWNRRFLASTRGRILSVLRRSGGTVNDLAEATGLSDNAVRAHLTTLERDGFVQPAGTRPSTRKPNVVYELTPEAAQVFPKPYAAVLQQLLEVLTERLAPADLDAILRAVGQRVAGGFRHAVQATEPRERILQVLGVLEEIGGLAEMEEHEEKLCIRGFDCPLGGAITGHRQVCRVAETLLADLLGMPVQEQCRTIDGSVRCYFEVAAAWGNTEEGQVGPAP
ncbi:MAG TPA: ArsR family transcriptional regulator [Gemmataceae bacterium]|nr:ArsR family transcriptional regulator [Gemmataceae bacterium]